MSIFSSFNNLTSNIIGSNILETSRNVSRVTSSLNTAVTSFRNISSGRGSTLDNVANALGAVDTLINGGNGSLGQVGSAIRMASNALQNVGYGASPQGKTFTKAIIRDDYTTVDALDWRVKITAPENLIQGDILRPIANTGSSMLFPFTPTIILGSSANYSPVHPTHTNHPFYAYENSQIDQITITGEFIQENERDAKYWIAVLHYFRTMTKMFYGESDPLGAPPLVSRLNGYGKHVLNNIPVVITNFTTDMPQDVDYIECKVNNEVNFVPIQSTFTVTVQPQYARRSHSRFSLNDYINGTHIGSSEGFV